MKRSIPHPRAASPVFISICFLKTEEKKLNNATHTPKSHAHSAAPLSLWLRIATLSTHYYAQTYKHTHFLSFSRENKSKFPPLRFKKINKNNNIYNQLLLKQTQLCYKKNTWNFHRDKLEREIERESWKTEKIHQSPESRARLGTPPTLPSLSLSIYLSSSSISLSPTPFKSGTSLSLSV